MIFFRNRGKICNSIMSGKMLKKKLRGIEKFFAVGKYQEKRTNTPDKKKWNGLDYCSETVILNLNVGITVV